MDEGSGAEAGVGAGAGVLGKGDRATQGAGWEEEPFPEEGGGGFGVNRGVGSGASSIELLAERGVPPALETEVARLVLLLCEDEDARAKAGAMTCPSRERLR